MFSCNLLKFSENFTLKRYTAVYVSELENDVFNISKIERLNFSCHSHISVKIIEK